MDIFQKEPDIVKQSYPKERSIVLIPNITAGAYLHEHYNGLRFFEERYLYCLSFLKQKNTQLVLVLSEGLEPVYLEYVCKHVEVITGFTREELEKRISYVWVPIGTQKVITEAIVRSPEIIQKIKRSVAYSHAAYIEFFRVTPEAVEVANQLELPWYGITKDQMYINEKIGSKKIFDEAGVAYAKGHAAYSFKEIFNKVIILAQTSTANNFLIKINDGGGGVGIVKFHRSILNSGFESFVQSLVLPGAESIDVFERSVTKEGCMVEEFIEAQEVRSPSVQFEIFPDGSIENRATHDQIIVDETVYMGVSFPANAQYRAKLIDCGMKIARVIQKQGGRGFMALDMLATRNTPQEEWSISAIEINARKGGTNHTYMWVLHLSEAIYDKDSGVLMADTGEISYRGTEVFMQEDWLKDIDPSVLLAAIDAAGLNVDFKTNSGVFIHMLSPLRQFGKFGCTVIGGSAQQVEELWQKLHACVADLKPIS